MAVKIEKKPTPPPADDAPPFADAKDIAKPSTEEPPPPPSTKGKSKPKKTAKEAKVEAEIPAGEEVPAAVIDETPPAVTKKPVVAQVEVQHASGATTHDTVKVGEVVHAIAQPMANVGYSAGLTVNLGDYNNVKFNVMLNMPCLPTPEGVEEAFSKIEAWVDAKVQKLRQDIEDAG